MPAAHAAPYADWLCSKVPNPSTLRACAPLPAHRLSPEHQALLTCIPARVTGARQAALQNSRFFRTMLSEVCGKAADYEGPPILALAPAAAERHAAATRNRVSAEDVGRVRYALRNLVRDWGVEGAVERAQSYGLIVAELTQRVLGGWGASSLGGLSIGTGVGSSPLGAPEPPRGPPKPPKVLVPGAGLGRLCLDLCAAGFSVVGNEFSYYMLLLSSFVLNHSREAEEFVVHPWVHGCHNHRSEADQLRPAVVPDVLPADLAQNGELCMAAGDFAEVFGRAEEEGAFEAVATSFFLDTAPNVVRYLEVIYHVLKPGGVWVNVGPLLYHWSGQDCEAGEPCVELSLSALEAVAQRVGFRLERKSMVQADFVSDPRSMQKNTYDCVFWTMVKPAS